MITFEDIRSKLKTLRWIDSYNSEGDPIQTTVAFDGMTIEASFSDFLKAWFVECVCKGYSHVITTTAYNFEEVQSRTLDWIAERIVNGLEQ